jgi:5-hydroxyisourate hydrolase-like protein (transthyretin family)
MMNCLRARLPYLLFQLAQLPLFAVAQITDGTGQITGRVISSETGQPIEKATVSLSVPSDPSWKRQAVTDEDGNYTLTWLPTEKFIVTAIADDFVLQTYHRPDEADPAVSKIVTVNDAAIISSIDFRLDSAGSLHGTIVELDGNPVSEGVSVAAVQPFTRANGEQGVHAIGSATTDATGHFAVKNLAPGSYSLCVEGPDGYGFAPNKAKIQYRETWLGDADTYTGAQKVDVRAGDTGPDLRIVVPRITGHSLTVVPIWSPSTNSATIKPDRFSASIAGKNYASTIKPDGSAIIASLPSGKYKVLEDAWQSDKYIGHGEVDVEIGDTDATVRVKVTNASPKQLPR